MTGKAQPASPVTHHQQVAFFSIRIMAGKTPHLAVKEPDLLGKICPEIPVPGIAHAYRVAETDPMFPDPFSHGNRRHFGNRSVVTAQTFPGE